MSGAGGEGAACGQPVYTEGLPDAVGCYAGTAEGWVQVPCLCDLWLENTTHDTLAVTLTLSLDQSEQTAPPSDTTNVELDIQDPDSDFYAVWSAQAAAGAPISVTHASAITAVRLEGASVVLDPVNVTGCSFITGTATVGATGITLDMHADFLDSAGSSVLTTDAACLEPPHL